MAANKFSRRAIARAVAAEISAHPAERTQWLRRAAAYLLASQRANEAELLANDIARELFAQNKQLAADVTSVRPLSAAVKAELTQALKTFTGAERVTLAEHHDPALVGGMVVRTPDAQLDLSIRSKLKQLATIN